MVALDVLVFLMDNWETLVGAAVAVGGPIGLYAATVRKAGKKAEKVADALIKTIDEVPVANKAIMAVAKRAGLEDAVKEIDEKLVQPRKRGKRNS